jgi:hypothetical protein
MLGAMAGYFSLWSVYWVFKQLTGKEGMGTATSSCSRPIGAWVGLKGILRRSCVVARRGSAHRIDLAWRRRARSRDADSRSAPYCPSRLDRVLLERALIDTYSAVVGLQR